MTDLILKIEGVEKAKAVEFYIERDRTLRLGYDDLAKVDNENGLELYAKINALAMGRGHLMARVLFDGVVVDGFTGYTIPCMGTGRTIACNGREVSFERAPNIPTFIYIGLLQEWVKGYEYITEEMVKRLDRKNAVTFDEVIDVERGSRLVIAVPDLSADGKLTVTKDNGFGGKTMFDTSIMGANGLKLKINGIDYNIYGEFFIVDGKIKIYIE